MAAAVQAIVDASDAPDGAHAVLLTGGTGIARRDTTVEALAARFDKTLDGFGELFRMLSFAEVGPAAMLSRATAGIIGGRGGVPDARLARRRAAGHGTADPARAGAHRRPAGSQAHGSHGAPNP